MAEYILYRESKMPTLFLNKGDADAAIRGGQYRRQPIAKATPTPISDEQNSESVEPTAEVAKDPPKPDSINVNAASLTELTEIKGIGLAKGKELIEKRPYQTAEDLIAVTESANWLELVENGDIWFG